MARKDVSRGMPRIDLADVQLASSETARGMNRDLVLELIRTHQPVSRADLSRLSGLQRSTVSLISEQLIEERWVREGAIARLPRGRRPTLLGLNDELAILVADIHPGEATLAVVDLNGRFLARTVLPLLSTPTISVEQIADEMIRMRALLPHKSFEGVGISMPGRIDPRTHELIFAPNLKWQGLDIKRMIEQRTGLRTELENGANAALLAELWTGNLHGVRDAVLITISEGIGAGILANGELLTGRNGMGGEFGHVPLDREGPLCACGFRGCWEVFASCAAAVRYYAELSGDGYRMDFHGLLRLAEAGDAHAAEAIDKQARAIGRGLRPVIAGLSPEVIIVSGEVTSAWHRYEPHLKAEMAALALGSTPPPRLVATDEGESTRLRGAAAIVLQRHVGYHNRRA